MDARDLIKIGMSAERTLIVPPERTVGHFVKGMPMVYATPMMILEMELASADAIKPCLEELFHPLQDLWRFPGFVNCFA